MTDREPRPTDEEVVELHLLCQAANPGGDYEVMRLGRAAREWLPRLLDLVTQGSDPHTLLKASAEDWYHGFETGYSEAYEKYGMPAPAAGWRAGAAAMREACAVIVDGFADASGQIARAAAAIRALPIPTQAASPPAEETEMSR